MCIREKGHNKYVHLFLQCTWRLVDCNRSVDVTGDIDWHMSYTVTVQS